MNISEELKQNAIALGLCGEWTEDWGSPDLDTLCEMFVTGQDFCIKHNYPTTNYIKENFGKIAENHGIYTDAIINLSNPDIAILLGTTKGSIILSGYVSRDIYVRHDSEVDIILKDHSTAFIRVFNNAKVRVVSNTTGRAFVYKYIDDFTGSIETEGTVLVREKRFSDL